jgi:hypothetical protein
MADVMKMPTQFPVIFKPILHETLAVAYVLAGNRTQYRLNTGQKRYRLLNLGSILLTVMSRHSSVVTATDYRVSDRGSIPSRDKFSIINSIKTGPEAHTVSYPFEKSGSFLWR